MPRLAKIGSATGEHRTDGNDTGKAKFVGEELAKSDRPELTGAEIVVSGDALHYG